jgi:2-polyprenyl-3-methyl-5-hydroxy-6-metoxy-1,4-benzoquinol methylase
MSKHIKYKRIKRDQDYFDQLSKRIAQEINKLLKNIKTPSILDAGCGNGELLKNINNNKILKYGIDIDRNCVKISKKHGTIKLGNIMDIKEIFNDNSVDLIVCSHVLEHLKNPVGAVEQMKIVSKKWIVLVVPNLATFTNLHMFRKPHYINKGHKFGWGPSHFKTFIEISCKLKIIK